MSNRASANKWESNNRDVICVRISDSSTSIIRSAANASGESINSYIVGSVLSYLGLPIPASNARFDPTPASACVVCGNPLPEGKARYCSEECKKKSRAAQAREARRKRLSQSQPPED